MRALFAALVLAHLLPAAAADLPPAMDLGGDFGVFIDATTGKVIEIVRGK